MTNQEPIAELDPAFSDADATATPWAEARSQLEDAEIFWLSTVRPDGRPHVTPLIAVWLEGVPWFVTGATERKARNLAENPRCVLTTGCNSLSEGLDVVVEGDAVRVVDDALLQRVANAYAAKYPEPFHFTVRDGHFDDDGLVFKIHPVKVFGFRHNPTSSQTRWRFRDV
jgi:pyridoxine/pyridoxamine 5'-phosphate oxidase